MLVSVHFMHQEYGPAAYRQLFHCASKRDSVNGIPQPIIDFAVLPFRDPCFLLRTFFQRQLTRTLLAEVHKDGVYGYSIEPSRECGITSKRPQFAKDLEEGVLSQILGGGSVARHA